MPEPARRSLRKSIPRSVWGLLVLSALIFAIGFLQIRWIDEVAKAQRERAAAAIQASVATFTSDFDMEITRVHVAFETANPTADPEAALRHRLALWRELAPYPRLVLRATAVIGERATLTPRMGKKAALPGQPGPEAGIRLVETADRGSLGILVPLIQGPAVAAENRPLDAQVMLDMDYIEQNFIPELVDRAFAKQRADLQVLITGNSDSNRLIWSSGPFEAKGPADLSARFFTLRPNCFMEVTGPPEPVSNQKSDVLLRQIIGRRTPTCGTQSPGPHAFGNWRIDVRYKAGSVDAVTTRFRFWSIGLSLGVLLVLFLAGLMLVLSTERARTLAKVQMEFAAAVSHELRTPLSAIRIAADNLSQGMVENRPQAQRYGSLIAAQVQHLTSLVSDVLLFSQSEASPVIPGLDAVRVEDVVEDALSNCALDLKEAGFHIERDLRLPLPDILASRHLITQCLINVIQNAIKYAGSGKFVGIHAVACNSGAQPGVQFDIVDHGPGIPHEETAQVFEPFYRGREARESQTSGLGLGLSIVKRIVDSHQGHVGVDSGPNSHTRFRIWIPAADSRDGHNA